MRFKDIHIVRKLNAPYSPRVIEVVDMIVRAAENNNLTRAECISTTTLVIAVGGDGTMLEAMRLAQPVGALAIGINLGNVGFLTDVTFSDNGTCNLIGRLDKLFSTSRPDHYFDEKRMMLRAKSDDDQVDMVAGNEISISGDKSDSMIRYRLWIDGVDAGIHRANSILISTPTGSTAYSLSVGGALVMPGMFAMQIVPVAPMTLTSRPIIVSGENTIRVDVWGSDIAVKRDGGDRVVVDSDLEPYTITVYATDNTVRVVHAHSWNFFDVLTEKLGWMRSG